MPDYLTLVQQLQREVGVSGAPITTVAGQTGLAGRLVAWIADSDQYIQSLHWDWNFLWSEYSISTIVGTPNPTVPADLGVWDKESFYLDYTLATHKRLRNMGYKDWRDSAGRGVKTNRKPNYVVVKPDKSIVLEPPPDAIYTLTSDYFAKPTRMASNTDVSLIPAQFHRIIVVQAKLYFAEEQEIAAVFEAAQKELYGDGSKKDPGLISMLESHELQDHERRRMQGIDLTVTSV